MKRAFMLTTFLAVFGAFGVVGAKEASAPVGTIKQASSPVGTIKHASSPVGTIKHASSPVGTI